VLASPGPLARARLLHAAALSARLLRSRLCLSGSALASLVLASNRTHTAWHPRSRHARACLSGSACASRSHAVLKALLPRARSRAAGLQQHSQLHRRQASPLLPASPAVLLPRWLAGSCSPPAAHSARLTAFVPRSRRCLSAASLTSPVLASNCANTQLGISARACCLSGCSCLARARLQQHTQLGIPARACLSPRADSACVARAGLQQHSKLGILRGISALRHTDSAACLAGPLARASPHKTALSARGASPRSRLAVPLSQSACLARASLGLQLHSQLGVSARACLSGSACLARARLQQHTELGIPARACLSGSACLARAGLQQQQLSSSTLISASPLAPAASPRQRLPRSCCCTPTAALSAQHPCSRPPASPVRQRFPRSYCGLQQQHTHSSRHPRSRACLSGSSCLTLARSRSCSPPAAQQSLPRSHTCLSGSACLARVLDSNSTAAVALSTRAPASPAQRLPRSC
jgi:hypothetical protein